MLIYGASASYPTIDGGDRSKVGGRNREALTAHGQGIVRAGTFLRVSKYIQNKT